jgi:cob(I)alamin adenosyltransferase
MSIVTKTGDKGTTALMYGHRVMKSHPRVEACGAVDELSSALGVARAMAGADSLVESLIPIQQDLIVLMGELAVLPQDLDRYVREGHSLVTPEMTSRVEGWIYQLEAALPAFQGWAVPGSNPLSATLDLARAVCRRAERSVCVLQREGELRNTEAVIYLNRLSDLLWLLARRAETPVR